MPRAPTEAQVLACDDFERAETRAEPTRSAQLLRKLRAGRTAQREEDFLEAVTHFEAALALAEDDGGVLGELGWARFSASRWCDAFESEAGSGDLAAECTAMNREAVVSELERALELAATDAQRGSILYNLGRVHEGVDPDAAARAFRQSLCVRPHASARGALGGVLARQARDESGEEALRLWQAAALFDAEARSGLERSRAHWNAELQLEAFDEPAGRAFPTIEKLCEETDEPDACRQRGEWIELDGWALTYLEKAVDEYSMALTHNLVARTSRGVFTLAELGTRSEDSRVEASYVGAPEITPIANETLPLAAVTWGRGTAAAMGCDWETEATTQLLLCTREDDAVRCFAGATLGAASYDGQMLVTVQDSLGNCEDYDGDESSSNQDEPVFDVSFDAREMVVQREHDGRMWCSPLVETLCALPHPPATCP